MHMREARWWGDRREASERQQTESGPSMMVRWSLLRWLSALEQGEGKGYEGENPTSCSRSRLMYEYVGRRDSWIGGKRPFYVS